MSLSLSLTCFNIPHDTQELINRVNRNSEECGIDIVEELMLYCEFDLSQYGACADKQICG